MADDVAALLEQHRHQVEQALVERTLGQVDFLVVGKGDVVVVGVADHLHRGGDFVTCVRQESFGAGRADGLFSGQADPDERIAHCNADDVHPRI